MLEQSTPNHLHVTHPVQTAERKFSDSPALTMLTRHQLMRNMVAEHLHILGIPGNLLTGTQEELIRMETVDGSKVIDTVSGVTGSGLDLSFPNGVPDNISYGEMAFLHRSIGHRTYRKRSAWIGAGTGFRANGSPVFGVQIIF